MTSAPAWVDMCSPSAISAIEPHSQPPAISAAIIVPHSATTAQLRRSLRAWCGPRKTCSWRHESSDSACIDPSCVCEVKYRRLAARMLKIVRPKAADLLGTMDFSNATILCIGDVMLDRFAYCETERISPEAPVPVLLLKRTQSMLGGAGNVARNIAALGGTAILMGLVGDDAAGAELAALVDGTPGLVGRLATGDLRPTICKTRYLAAHQQMLRVDEEQTHELRPDEET